jgi:hypothetical protein
MKNRLVKIIVPLIIIIIISGFLVNIIKYNNIIRQITVEAGEKLPAANDFIKSPDGSAEYISDLSGISPNEPGMYEVCLKYKNKTYKVRLSVEDTVPPGAIPVNHVISKSAILKPIQFVSDIKDGTTVSAVFKTEPPFGTDGEYDIEIVLTDKAGNTTELVSKLYITETKPDILIEAGDKLPELKDCLMERNQAARLLTDMSAIDSKIPGDYEIEISINSKKYTTLLKIRDTIAPKGTVKKLDLDGNEPIQPELFFADINDISPVKVSYIEEPDFNKINTQNITLLLEDASGNTSEYRTELRISKIKETISLEVTDEKYEVEKLLKNQDDKAAIRCINHSLIFNKPGEFELQIEIEGKIYTCKAIVIDTKPPEIYTAKRQTAYIGKPIRYKKDVYAFDNVDGNVEITVDSESVNPKVEGEYNVYYRAEDSSGNISEKVVVFSIIKQTITMEELEKLADEVLNEIITEDMTLREKAWEIYQYTNKRLIYTGFSDKSDWMIEAYNGIVNGVGDCFTYYSMSNIFLERIGIETLSVQRASRPHEAKHYWHMVNYGEGWYHFDACIHKPKLVSFMLTDAEIDAYSRRAGKDNYYYRYDRENYPRTPEK